MKIIRINFEDLTKNIGMMDFLKRKIKDLWLDVFLLKANLTKNILSAPVVLTLEPIFIVLVLHLISLQILILVL